MFPTNKTTVDPKVKEFYKDLSSSWWDNSKLNLLRNGSKLLAPYYCVKIQEHFSNKPLESLSILDVGCGGGFLTERLAQFGFNITAIDINEEMIQTAKEHADQESSSKIDYICGSIEDHCQKNFQQYDVVISDFVLQHVADHDYFIKCCADCVKPDGLLFMAAASKTFLNWLCTIVIAENVINLIPKGTHDYNRCICAPDTERIMTSYGFHVTETKGIFGNPFSRSVFFFPTNTFAYVVCAERKCR